MRHLLNITDLSVEEINELLELGNDILDHPEKWLPHFKKIVPGPYQAMLERISHYEELGIGSENARMEAFLDLTRKNGGA